MNSTAPLRFRPRRPIRGVRLALAALALVFAGGCAALPGPLGTRSEACIPHFPYTGGWLGGDAVYSIPVPSGEGRHETIWLFGDSYVGDPGARSRDGSTLVHNSVARSTCDAKGVFEIEYAWKRNDEGRPAAVFEATRPRHDAWPFDGFFLNGRLYVFLLETRAHASSGLLGLPISISGTSLARVDNPDDPVAYWRVSVLPLSPDDRAVISTSVLVEGEHAYMMAAPMARPGRHPRFLLRLPLEAIEAWPDDLTRYVETFTHRGGWEPGIQPLNARILMHDNASEMSLDFDPETGLYLVVYGAPVQTADDGSASKSPEIDASSIFVRTAMSLTGPWSERRRLHLIADALEADAMSSKSVEICYAAKAHAEHSPPGVLVSTHVCNLAPGEGRSVWGALETMQSRMDLYRPRVFLHVWPLPDEDGFPTEDR